MSKMADGIELKGIKEFSKFMKVLPDSLQRRVTRQALKASAKPIIMNMKNNLARHRRTGNLINSIKSTSAKGGRGRVKREVAILVGAIKSRNRSFLPDGFYARFLEMGTAKQPPRPWARPAIDAATPTQRRVLAQEFGKRAIKEVKRQSRKIIGIR